MLANSNPIIDIRIACAGWPPREALRKLAEKSVLSAIKAAKLKMPAQAELSLMFSDDKTVASLNGKFRKISAPTNVLSFPCCDIAPGEPSGKMLGDIVFALQTIQKEARIEKKPFECHLSHLMIHGFLHLFGYDHITEDEAIIMENLEKKALAGLGIADPYGDCKIDPIRDKT